MHDLAIVILNWNGRSFLADFLPKVIAYSQPHRIILADNASTDDSVAFVKEQFPSVEIILNESNGGFAKGYNDALKKVDATFYLLLNSDIEVTENWTVPLLKAMEDPTVAGVQPKVLAYHRKEYFEHAGATGGFIDRLHYPFCRGRIFDSVEKDKHQYDYPTPIFWATGASLLIRSEVYWKAGGLDERFFAHMEEIDLCWKAQHLGYHFLAIPESVIYHVGGGTLNYNNPRKTFLNFRNSLLMIHTNYDGWLFPTILRRLLLDGLVGVQFTLSLKFKHLWAIIKAHFSYYGMFSSSQAARKQWKAQRKPARIGVYNGSIIWAYLAQRVKVFSDLNQRRFKHNN